jgi:hypothetical protein
MTGLLLAAAFALIIGGAILFTNAIEWSGNRLDLGEGAVGSLLAAVGTALPESLIPVVAVGRALLLRVDSLPRGRAGRRPRGDDHLIPPTGALADGVRSSPMWATVALPESARRNVSR